MKTKKIIYGALFITIGIVLDRLFSINLQFVRIGFKFVPMMMSALFFPPLMCGIIGALTDYIGIVLFPFTGAPFYGFTLTSFVTNMIYSYFLYKKDVNCKNVITAVTLKTFICELGLNSYWLILLKGRANVFMSVRFLKSMFILPVQVIVFMSLVYALKKSSFFKNNLKNA